MHMPRNPDSRRGAVGSNVDRSIAEGVSADIKCINYFRFRRFTHKQNATLARRDIGKEEGANDREGMRDRMVTLRPKILKNQDNNEKTQMGGRRRGTHYATDIRTREDDASQWSKTGSPK